MTKQRDDNKRVLVVFGTRPEAIKMAPVVKALRKKSALETTVCVTGQHREMLDQVLKVFKITPQYDLYAMRKGQDLFDIMGAILVRLRDVMNEVKPDLVLVHGDTSTSFIAALSAYYLQIPVGHVEAGLRTNNIYSPYPEEFNRQAVGLLARLNFAPTMRAKQNLLDEGKRPETIFVTGNTVIDALNTTVGNGHQYKKDAWIEGSRLLLITAHRRENLGDPMHHMFNAIRRIVDEYDDVKAIYPVHLNPRVQALADEHFGDSDKVRLINPLNVLDFHNLMARCHIVLTDSGGIQEEAPSLGKPVLVMRDTTERPEGVAAGTLKLVGTHQADIYNACKQLLDDATEYDKMSKANNPYGDGTASVQIADIVEKFLSE